MSRSGIFISLCVLGCVSVSLAGWSPPIFLSELNDPSTGTVATRPTVTEDQLCILFLRNGYLWEASRNSIDEMFSEQRIVSELGYDGDGILYAWVSPDGLRLYYNKAKKDGKIWKDSLFLAVRNDRSELWTEVRELDDLHLYMTRDKQPSLTADETVIMWISDRGRDDHDYIIWMADRPSPVNPFENLREVSELNDFGAEGPFLSADGLTVYFSLLKDDTGSRELWKGSRESREDFFGNFEPLEEINQWGATTISPWVSPDQRTIYFFQRWGEVGDTTKMGICMSTWTLDPRDTVIGNLEEAIELKERAIDLMDRAREKETRAFSGIGDLLCGDDLNPQDKRVFWQARIQILQAMTRQVLAKIQIRSALRKLTAVVELLLADPSQSEPERPGRPGKSESFAGLSKKPKKK